MRYVGLDVHWRQSSICVLDTPRDESCRCRRYREVGRKSSRSWERPRSRSRFVSRHRRATATCSSSLSTMAHRVVVAHPGQLRLIFRSKRKNDRVDAEKLAKLLFLDEVPPVHVPSAEVRSWRSMIEHRRKLVAEQTRTKNGIRSLLRNQGIEAPRGLWTRRGLTWLASVQLVTDLDELQRDIMRERLESIASMIQPGRASLESKGTAHPGVQLLRTIPGVGPRTGEAVVAYIDKPGRFHSNKAIGCYFGLIPKQDASGRSNRLGHITREGPSVVRSLLVEAAWQGIRRCPQIRKVTNASCETTSNGRRSPWLRRPTT